MRRCADHTRGKGGNNVQSTEHQAISTDRANPPAGPYNQGVRWGDLIFTASVAPRNPQLGDPPADDVRAATRGALENVKAIVEAGGGGLDTVLKVTLYLRDMADFAGVNEVYQEYFSGGVLPARALVPVPSARSAVSFDAIAYRRR
jgi:2-iminobutanoate/2-iminopropanoate deaminase